MMTDFGDKVLAAPTAAIGIATDSAFDLYLQVPDLDEMELLPGVRVELSALDSAAPRLVVGSVVFTGKFQDIIGTAVAVCAVDGAAAASVAVAAIAAKCVIFELVSGCVNDITVGLEDMYLSDKEAG